MAYKEIQVPASKIRSIYEPFLKEVEPYVELITKRNIKKQQMDDEYRESERERYQRYLQAGGDETWRDPSYRNLLNSSWPFMKNSARIAQNDALAMLKAVEYCDNITLTENQVRYMSDFENGKLIEEIKEEANRPLKQRASFFDDKELIPKKPEVKIEKPTGTDSVEKVREGDNCPPVHQNNEKQNVCFTVAMAVTVALVVIFSGIFVAFN